MKYVELGGSEALAGVGRANNASNVGNATYVHGVAGSNTFPNLAGSTDFAAVKPKRQNTNNGNLMSRATENW